MSITTRKIEDGFVSRPLMLTVLMVAAVLLLTGCATFMGKKTKPVTVAEIVAMSREKVPSDKIIEKMRDSGTVYRLKATELVKLKDEGVPDAVLNYMQQTYLEAVRRDQRLEDWNRWTMGEDGYWYGGSPYGWPYY